MGGNSEDYINMREKEYMINATFKVKGKLMNVVENYLMETSNLISYKTVRDTNKLYKEDDTFKKLVKNVKKAIKTKDIYAMNNNHKYLKNE